MNKKRLMREVYATYVLFWLITTSRKPVGTNVFERDWDVLVILDTCRVDALREVQDEYDFLGDIEEIWSIGSTSKEWVDQTFREKYSDEIAETAYITGNPFSNTLLGERKKVEYGSTHDTWIESAEWTNKIIKDTTVSADKLGHLEPLWGDFDNNRNESFSKSQKPSSIINHTIAAGRTGKFDRIIAHCMQPHSPYFSSSNKYEELNKYEKYPFRALKEGKTEKVWDAYIDNLRYILDHVEKLIQNTEGEVVLTADHGELMGEQRMYYHMPGNFHPKLKKVPWVRTQATDNGTVDPDVTLSGKENAQEVTAEQLEALGYI